MKTAGTRNSPRCPCCLPLCCRMCRKGRGRTARSCAASGRRLLDLCSAATSRACCELPVPRKRCCRRRRHCTAPCCHLHLMSRDSKRRRQSWRDSLSKSDVRHGLRTSPTVCSKTCDLSRATMNERFKAKLCDKTREKSGRVLLTKSLLQTGRLALGHPSNPLLFFIWLERLMTLMVVSYHWLESYLFKNGLFNYMNLFRDYFISNVIRLL